MIARAVGILWRQTYARYIAASVGALGADIAVFMALLASGLSASIASALGYAVGIGAHWLLSSRAVFTTRVADDRETRRKQKALFIGSALVGLALTVSVVGLGDMLGLDPRLAKLVAIVVSFQTTYLLRKTIVFA